MGISRVFYGRMSEKLDLTRTMLGCGALCVMCYLLASLSSSPVPGLMGCALCGISVGIMWPGTLSISAQKCPRGGTVMFALLALAGDLGGSIGPSLVGSVSSMADGNLKTGLLAATVFPVLLISGLLVLKDIKLCRCSAWNVRSSVSGWCSANIFLKTPAKDCAGLF